MFHRFMDEDLKVSELISKAHLNAVEKGWWDNDTSLDRNFGTSLMLVVSELAEAMEEYRNGRGKDEIWYGPDGKPEGIPVELADVVIRIADLCGQHGIPLVKAIHEKMAYNKTRPFRHGNKKA